jgi:deoxycytidylate deaminase
MGQKLIIGLTGSFGSGCTSTAKYLESSSEFQRISLSGILEELAAAQKVVFKERGEKQLFGNQLRLDKGPHALAELAEERIGGDKVVIECFRNDNEVEYFQGKYPYFYLIAIHASKDSRWRRLKKEYKGNQATFDLDDDTDQEEHIAHGQQIRKCVELADVVIRNEKYWDRPKDQQDYKRNVDQYVRLLTEPFRPPTADEFNMHVAHSIKFFSSCLKRHVGATITTVDYSNIISWGFNEVPRNSPKCHEAYGECYRDRKTLDLFKSADIAFCPKCGKPLDKEKMAQGLSSGTSLSGLSCPSCEVNLPKLMNPTKILDYCRALHAEENAILRSVFRGGESLSNKVLYTTTYPCNLCAKKIVNSGIGEVIFIEPYPMKEAEQILLENKVKIREFEGIKAQAYYRVFKDRRSYLETNLK